MGKEGYNDAQKCWCISIRHEDLKNVISTDDVECFSQVNENHEEGTIAMSAYLL